MDDLAGRHRVLDLIQEGDDLLMGMVRRAAPENRALQRVQRSEPTAERLAVRILRSAPTVGRWMRLPGAAPVAEAMNYVLDRWPSFARFLDDGRVCMANNAAERALRGLALGRTAWLFAGSNRDSQLAALFNSLIVTAKLNDVNPQACLADVLGRIASHPAQRLTELLPWNWRPTPASMASLNAAA